MSTTTTELPPWLVELNAAVMRDMNDLCDAAYKDTPVREVASDGRAFVRRFASEMLGAARPLSKQIKDLKKLAASRDGESNIVTALLCPIGFRVTSPAVMYNAKIEWTHLLDGAEGTAGFREWMYKRKYQYAGVLFQIDDKCIIGLGFAARFPGAAAAASASGDSGRQDQQQQQAQRPGTPIPHTEEPFQLGA